MYIPSNLRYFHLSKKDVSVCEWGSSTNIDNNDDYIGSQEFSDNLHCTLPVRIVGSPVFR